MNQFNDQLPVGLLAQLVRALHRYHRGQGSNPGKPDFFGLSFRNCISCINITASLCLSGIGKLADISFDLM